MFGLIFIDGSLNQAKKPMAEIENPDPSGQVKAGITLKITGAESENEALRSVENYLKLHHAISLEVGVIEGAQEGEYLIKLG